MPSIDGNRRFKRSIAPIPRLPLISAASERDKDGERNMDRRKAIAVGTAIFTAVISFILGLNRPVFHDALTDFLGSEVFTNVLQFFLVALLGGLIFLYISILKDAEEKRNDILKEEAEKRYHENSLRRELARGLDKFYRDTKHVRRALNAHRRKGFGDTNVVVNEQLWVDKLDKLDEIQVSLEHARKTLASSTHLFAKGQCETLASAIQYYARFLQSVFRDFQVLKTATRDDGCILISPDKSHNLHDFLSSVKLPNNIRDNLQDMRDKKLPLKQRWKAFNDISKKGSQVSEGEKRRYWYRVVAEECLKLAAAEIEMALSVSRSPERLAIALQSARASSALLQ